MSSMRAWQVPELGEPADVLRLADVDEPVAGPGEVRVRVEAAAVGLPDALLCRGTYPFRPPRPFVPGQEVCGVVDAVGDGVDDPALAPGRRVMGVTCFPDGRGGFAGTTVLAADNAFRVPDDLPAAEAAGFRIGFSTAWTALVRRAELRTGETLVVLGAAGGSGIAAVRLGHALGARVVAVASGPEKCAYCAAAGADVVMDRARVAVADLPGALRDATGGRGADVVFDPVGGALAGAALSALAPRGRFLAVGFASGEWVAVDALALVARNQSLLGVLAAGWGRADELDAHERLLALWAQGRLRVEPTVVPFDDLPQALTRVAAGEAVGKLVLAVAPR
ncbi:MAG: zinc-binding dehydrogenase [Acidimicrobiales bacterium]|nr:zinc-binding dehydrogenase [Acidimicrobiales bacterium]